MLPLEQAVPGLHVPGFEFLWPVPYVLAAAGVIAVPPLLARRRAAAAEPTGIRWIAIVPIAGVVLLAASNLGLYARQLSWQGSCPSWDGRVSCYEADSSLFGWGILWATFTVFLAAAYVWRRRHLEVRWLTRRFSLGLVGTVAGAFVVVITALSLTTSGAVSMEAANEVGRAFVTLGFLVLFLVSAEVLSFDGVWERAGQIAGLVHGTVAMTVAFISVAAALGPPPLFL